MNENDALRLGLLSLGLQGRSAGMYEQEQVPGLLGFTPSMLSARLGLENEGLRAGVRGTAVFIPGQGYQMVPPMFDLGYGFPFAGGTLDISGSADARRQRQLMLRYLRSF